MADPFITNLFVVLELALLEGVLGLDNAIVLAACVKKNLDHPADQKRALLYGMIGAYTFRILAVFFGVYLFKYEWIRLFVGLYLVGVSIKELFFNKPHHSHDIELKVVVDKKKYVSKRKIFWLTILNIELLDLMFSIDSIAVALAISNEVWVLIAGSILGIIAMRVAAQYFVKLIARFPIFQTIAFIILGFADVNVLIKFAKNL